jgi:hypothetical protein
MQIYKVSKGPCKSEFVIKIKVALINLLVISGKLTKLYTFLYSSQAHINRDSQIL